ncbi:META domain-containing protein [Pontivivens ytuae]|uniref:META domain protein n=1 Tax=Pontivivens ytuae TaxID=2789856 RepID=A0A7S9LSD1_9RHOB|nr:hypothetical protein [Pontivivens ytuae]QPH54422.1 hypothetical protein I0K15_01160 [Pontivivens ytuae]
MIRILPLALPVLLTACVTEEVVVPDFLNRAGPAPEVVEVAAPEASPEDAPVEAEPVVAETDPEQPVVEPAVAEAPAPAATAEAVNAPPTPFPAQAESTEATVADAPVALPSEPQATPPAARPLAIGEVDWSLAVLNGRLVGRVMEVNLGGGRISGDGPCQGIDGNYLGTGDIFVVETFIVPRLPGCERATIQEEIATAMLSARSALIEDGVLVMRDERGRVLMEFLPVPV